VILTLDLEISAASTTKECEIKYPMKKFNGE